MHATTCATTVSIYPTIYMSGSGPVCVLPPSDSSGVITYNELKQLATWDK